MTRVPTYENQVINATIPTKIHQGRYLIQQRTVPHGHRIPQTTICL